MVKVYFTFIRHGESTDNLMKIWAGWRDAPLSQHGMNQANALAKAQADTRYTAILASPLKRALMTAEIIREAQYIAPPINTSPLLREQHFGVAEGKSYGTAREPGLSLEEHFAKDIFPVLRERYLKFPEGESRNELAQRANQAIDKLLIPYIQSAIAEGTEESHIAVVSHGLFIREITMALLKRNTDQTDSRGIWHLQNTGWTRLKVETTGVDQLVKESWPGVRLEVRIIDYHRSEHLSGLVRQKAGIGSMAHDPNQKDIRAFFNKDMRP
ncbi:hypothetical protein APHAL10511_002694 [Amanita phalloides]|nr:hypothetical protein APHAL10511_002694 [Amanita phalloides]